MAVRSPIFSLESMFPSKYRKQTENEGIFSLCNFWSTNDYNMYKYVQVILFEIDCAIFYTNLHELFGQFIS